MRPETDPDSALRNTVILLVREYRPLESRDPARPYYAERIRAEAAPAQEHSKATYTKQPTGHRATSENDCPCGLLGIPRSR